MGGGCKGGLAFEGGRTAQSEHQRWSKVRNGEGRGGGGPGGGLAPGRWAKRVPLTRVGLEEIWKERGEALPSIGTAGSAPAPCRGDPRVFRIPRTGGLETRGMRRSPPLPLLGVGGGGKGGGRGRSERHRTAMGAAITVPSGGRWWAGRG